MRISYLRYALKSASDPHEVLKNEIAALQLNLIRISPGKIRPQRSLIPGARVMLGCRLYVAVFDILI